MKVILGIVFLLLGLAIGINIGAEIGWWRCFRSFERYSKRTK